MGLFAAALTAAVASLLAAEYRGWRAGIWLAKPLASTVFVAAGLHFSRLDSAYSSRVVVALAFSWLGDVLLIPREPPAAFRLGIGAFALAHVAYVYAFLAFPFAPARAALVAAPAGLATFLAGRWLRPHLPADLRVPVYGYMGVITTMLIASGSASAVSPLAFAGALLFYVSDLTVARDRFVAPGFANSLVGLPLYYAAQLVLAASAGL